MRIYALDLGLEGQDVQDLITFVTALDETYMDVTQEQIQSEIDKGK
jgi:hypothetical protein